MSFLWESCPCVTCSWHIHPVRFALLRCASVFFHPDLPLVSTPDQLFSCFSPKLYHFFFFLFKVLKVFLSLRINPSPPHLPLPRHRGRRQGGRGNSHYLWEHTLTSVGFIPTAFKPLQPPSGSLSVTRSDGSRNSPCSRMTPITSHLLHNLFFPGLRIQMNVFLCLVMCVHWDVWSFIDMSC